MTMQEVGEYLEQKIAREKGFVKITFYEIRVKYNLTKEETNYFLGIAKNKFENMGYSVYFTNDTFEYNGIKMKVPLNELMVAIKK